MIRTEIENESYDMLIGRLFSEMRIVEEEKGERWLAVNESRFQKKPAEIRQQFMDLYTATMTKDELDRICSIGAIIADKYPEKLKKSTPALDYDYVIGKDLESLYLRKMGIKKG